MNSPMFPQAHDYQKMLRGAFTEKEWEILRSEESFIDEFQRIADFEGYERVCSLGTKLLWDQDRRAEGDQGCRPT